MTLDENNRNSLINLRIQQAKETISDAKLLIENNSLRSAVNRVYYGMFYMLLALALKHQFETSKHQQLIGWFNKNFIKTGKIDSKYSASLKIAFENRTKGDYEAIKVFTKEEVDVLFKLMKEFIAAIENYLSE